MPIKKKPRRAERYKNSAFLKALGSHCRNLRRSRGYSIDRMARESEQLSTSVIHRLETGDAPVNVSVLERYAAILGLAPHELMHFTFKEKKQSGADLLRTAAGNTPKEAFLTLLPLFSIRVAAGYFGEGEPAEPEGWLDARVFTPLDENMFVARIHGQSMAPKLLDGDLGVFRAHPSGSRQGKIVLAQYRGPADPETGGSFTVKKYSSVKVVDQDGTWRHKEIKLSPLNADFEAIEIPSGEENGFRVIAEFLGLLNR